MRFWLLVCLCITSGPAIAGLFADNDARKQVQLLEARIVKLEKALAVSETDKEQNIRSTLDLQIQMETLSAELRKLRGQNEEFTHNLQDAEKRQKDFYIDLDTRLRRIEAGDAAANAPNRAAAGKDAGHAGESRAFEAAYALYKAENYPNAATAFRDFLKNYPQSVHEANVLYWMGNAYFLQGDCKNSMSSYEEMVGKYQDHPRGQEAMLNIADCQLRLKKNTAAKKTLKQLISRYPGSDTSEKAKKRLAAIK
jgi:tol-pal system protein YbgF